MRLTVSTPVDGLNATVVIGRPDGSEILPLASNHGDHHVYESASAAAEPHEFEATLFLRRGIEEEALPFHVAEPDGHR